MRKRTLALLFLSFVSLPKIYSQLAVGVIGGPSRTYFWGPDFTEIHAAINYIAGVSAEYSFTDVFSIVVQPRYDVKGNSFKVPLTDEKGNPTGELTLRNNLSYLSLPILLQAKLGTKVKFIINAGTYVSYLVAAKRKFSTSNPLFPKEKTKDEFKKTDAGISFGLGAEFPITKQIHLTAQITNDVGLVDISDLGGIPLKVHNNSTALLLGLSYAF